jgi:phenylacetic acid degradation protein paaN
MKLFDKHQPLLDAAIKALHARTFYAHFQEQPSPSVYGETADADGQAKFQGALHKRFEEIHFTEDALWVGEEESPYLQTSLGITYPTYPLQVIIDKSQHAFHQWRKIPSQKRAGILLESLMRVKDRFFEIAYATMHTTGQGFMMAFQASGPHAADRALEAIAAAYEELQRFPNRAVWTKPMGKYSIELQKEWRAVPKGISLVIGCSTFPTWNSVPSIYASLMTGNPVIVKPHPGAILPIAIVVAEIQKVMQEENFDPNICQLAADVRDNAITKPLAEHPSVKMIDFTGNATFGNYLESLPNKTVFTEKTGVNSVILDSVEDIDKVAANLAFAVSLYSGQMCTAPQNFYIPASGIKTSTGLISFDEFASKFVSQIEGLVDNPKAGHYVLGAIQNKQTLKRLEEVSSIPGKIWLSSKSFQNPVFSNARVATPLVLSLKSDQKEHFSKELFGPIVLLIETKDTHESIALAKALAISHGAISCGAYTTDKEIKDLIADEMAMAATPVSFNLIGGIYMNQNAAFSDFHVTGGNPAGNASFTNPEYVNKRFTWVGHREPVRA